MTVPDAAVAVAREWFAIDESRYSGDVDWPEWDSDENAAARASYIEDAATLIEAAMPAIREALAQELIKNGPVLNYELNHDGTEDKLRAAYVEGHRDAVGIVRGGTP